MPPSREQLPELGGNNVPKDSWPFILMHKNNIWTLTDVHTSGDEETALIGIPEFLLVLCFSHGKFDSINFYQSLIPKALSRLYVCLLHYSDQLTNLLSSEAINGINPKERWNFQNLYKPGGKVDLYKDILAPLMSHHISRYLLKAGRTEVHRQEKSQ